MSNKKVNLSKSRLMKGMQCLKAIYLSIHHPELEPKVSDSQQALFDQGKNVGIEAQKRFPGGTTVSAPYYDTQLAVAQTQDAISNGTSSVYEATFSAEGQTAKVDILHRPAPQKPWQIIEVKSSTSVKPEHLTDVAIQALIVEKAGCEADKAVVMHINNQAIAPNLENLFVQVDVTKEIKPIKADLPAKINEIRDVLSRPKPPDIDIGPQCDDPYECPFKEHCWQHVKSPSVFEIPRIGNKAWDYYKDGIISINDPRLVPTASQKKRIDAVRAGKRFVDYEEIAAVLANWNWPLYFLDFETIGYAIPIHKGTRPYEQIPIQFSCLIQNQPGGQVDEFFFLHDNSADPRPGVIPQLLEALKGSGPIVAYNMGFEKKCIEGLARFDESRSKQLLALTERLVDPLPIFRSAVYDAEFKGSFSIKEVAPAILGDSHGYGGEEIKDGQETQRAFLELIDSKTPKDRREQLKKSMLAYCRKDTQEMVDLVGWLLEQTVKKSCA